MVILINGENLRRYLGFVFGKLINESEKFFKTNWKWIDSNPPDSFFELKATFEYVSRQLTWFKFGIENINRPIMRTISLYYTPRFEFNLKSTKTRVKTWIRFN